MLRFIAKIAIYFLLLLCCVTTRLLSPLGVGSVLLLTAVLAAVNTLIRPILVTIALPFNIITMGIASVFANLLTLVIANAIVGRLIDGFWVMLLLALFIMLADDTTRNIRQAIRKHREAASN